MKSNYKWLIPGALLVASLGLAGCDVEKTEEGKMPDVDVNVEEGKLPKYDVDAPDVDVNTEKKVITVPDVDVDMPDDDEPDVGEPVEPATKPQN